MRLLRLEMEFQAMKRINVSKMTVEQLVDCFAAIALDQAEAILMDDNAKFNRLFWQMEAVEGQLKARSGDQRRRCSTIRPPECAGAPHGSEGHAGGGAGSRLTPASSPRRPRRNFRRPAMPACRSSILIEAFSSRPNRPHRLRSLRT